MVRVRAGDVNNVYVWVGGEFSVGTVCCRCAVGYWEGGEEFAGAGLGGG